MSLDHDVIAAARMRGLELATAPPMPWLTDRGHLTPVVQRTAPADVIDRLDELHASLGGDRRVLARQSTAPRRIGLVVRTSGQLVAVDDVAHFTSDRLASLDAYPRPFPFGFSLEQYRTLIETWRDRATAVFTKRWSPDFDFAGGRRAHRAYVDALADLLTPIFTGLPLVRLAVPDHQISPAVDRLARSLV